MAVKPGYHRPDPGGTRPGPGRSFYMLQLAENDGVVQAELGRRLSDVELRFADELDSDLPCVNALAGHIESYRGKMLRPTLVLASAMAAYPDRDDDGAFRGAVVTVATVAEMVHMATLVHDDILDEAEMRRRGTTVNHLRGNEAAVMLGDYLISHAYHLCSSLPRSAASRALAAATNTVCEGELLQLHHRDDWTLTEATYFEVIRRKTASLCGTCCRLPAVLASGEPDGGDEPAADPLYRYGEKLGVAFQIVDDVLDLTGDPRVVGKTLGRDLEKGKLTLPLIRMLDGVPASEAAALRRDLATPHDPEAMARLDAALDATGGVAYARSRAARLVDEAKATLRDAIPPGPARNLLAHMADAVLSRRF